MYAAMIQYGSEGVPVHLIISGTVKHIQIDAGKIRVWRAEADLTDTWVTVTRLHCDIHPESI